MEIVLGILLAALYAGLGIRSLFLWAELQVYKEYANAWFEAISLAHVKEWDKYEELSPDQQQAVLKFAVYLIRSVEKVVDGETTESEKITVKTSGNIAQKR